MAVLRSELAGCRSTLSMSKIKVKISETKFLSSYKTLEAMVDERDAKFLVVCHGNTAEDHLTWFNIPNLNFTFLSKIYLYQIKNKIISETCFKARFGVDFAVVEQLKKTKLWRYFVLEGIGLRKRNLNCEICYEDRS